MPASFAKWLQREMPAGTVIGDPAWWAPRIYKAARNYMQSAQPVAQPLTDKRISWLWSESHNDTTDRMAFQVFARAIEAAHGIPGMVEAATRPAVDAASKQGDQHE